MLSFSMISDVEVINGIQSVTASFEKKDLQQREILSQIYTIQSQQRRIEKELERLESQRNKLTRDIKEQLNKIEELRAQMSDLKTLIAMRLRVSGQIVDSSMKDIVLLSKNPNEIERMLKGLSFLLEKDVDLVKSLQAKRVKTEQVQQQARIRIKDLTATKQAQQLKASSLEKLKAAKNTYIDKIQKDKKKYLSILSELRKKGEISLLLSESKNASSMIRKSFFESKRQLDLPIKGYVSQGYGAFSKGKSIKLFSKGIYFNVDSDRDVSSVAYGKVVFVGDIKGYKNTIVLDHNNHYYTVYSFLRDISVKVGQQVERQQVLGKSGYNPYMDEKGMYFEIRHFSDPLNPADWFISDFKNISQNKSAREGSL